TAATASSAVVMLGLAVVLRFTSEESVLPFAYALAASAGFVRVWQLRVVFGGAEEPELPRPGSGKSLAPEPGGRRFLKGGAFFLLGAFLAAPVLPPYLINELHAPTAYFPVTAVLSSIAAVIVQRRWGRIGDENGARRMLLLGGIGAGF